MKRSLLIAFCLSIAISSFSQEAEFDDTQLFYRREIVGGLLFHTSGWGLNFRYTKRIDGFRRWIFTADFMTQKHPKEVKIDSPLKSYKSYVLGKINYFDYLHPAIGREKILFKKELKNGVQISRHWVIGPSLGIKKPVYLIVGYPNINDANSREYIEPYDPQKHTQDKIYGRASYLFGLRDITIVLGLHAKFGLTFEYAPLDEMIRSIETGISLDAFPKPVEMMAFTENKQIFLNYYLIFNMGKKYIE